MEHKSDVFPDMDADKKAAADREHDARSFGLGSVHGSRLGGALDHAWRGESYESYGKTLTAMKQAAESRLDQCETTMQARPQEKEPYRPSLLERVVDRTHKTQDTAQASADEAVKLLRLLVLMQRHADIVEMMELMRGLGI